ncbi:MAG: RNA polymerase sigma factor [Candidatus Promineifilaceae bacterium]
MTSVTEAASQLHVRYRVGDDAKPRPRQDMSTQERECHDGAAERVQTIDRSAIASIYDEYQPLVYRYVARRVGDVDAARDLTAEVFQRLLQAVHRGYGPSENLRAWMYRTAHNTVVDHYRRQSHRNHLPLQDSVIAGGQDPARTAESQILAGQVREALSELTDDQQQVIGLRFLEGLSLQEVATITDKSVGAVKALQHRGLAALQRLVVKVPDEVLK